MSKNNHWLAQQISSWVEEKIITRNQAEKLLLRHPAKDSSGLGRLLITGLGAIMIGLGIVLLFAYNWAEMNKYIKLGIIFGILTGTHVLATLQIKRNAVLSEGLFVLGTMLMGAAIFLVGQIYHIDNHYPDAFLLWSTGALVMAWARRSLSQAFITIILVLSWHIMEIFSFQFPNHLAFLLILVGIFPLVWHLDSPILARLTSAGLFITLGLTIGVTNEDQILIILLMFAAATIYLDRYIQLSSFSSKIISTEIAKPAILVLFGIQLLMTYGALQKEILLISQNFTFTSVFFWFALLISQFGFVWLTYKRQLNALVLIAELSVIMLFIPMLFIENMDRETLRNLRTLYSISFNLILLSSSVWLMIDGARRANRRHMVYGSILFAILAMARYIDLFESLIARAVVFLVVGIILFTAGSIYQRNKKGKSV